MSGRKLLAWLMMGFAALFAFTAIGLERMEVWLVEAAIKVMP